MLPFAEAIGKDGVTTRFRMWSDQHRSQLLGVIAITERAGHRYEWSAESEARPTGVLNAEDLNGQFTLTWVAGTAWAMATVTDDKAAVVTVDGVDVKIEAPNGFHQRLVHCEDAKGARRDLGLIRWESPHGQWKWIAVPADNSITFTHCESIVDAIRTLRGYQRGE